MLVKAAGEDASLLQQQHLLVEKMANTSSFTVSPDAEKPEASAVVLGAGLESYITLAGLVDFVAERARLTKERMKLQKDEERLAKKLSNQGFLAKAAAEIIEKDRAKHAELAAKIKRIAEQLSELD